MYVAVALYPFMEKENEWLGNEIRDRNCFDGGRIDKYFVQRVKISGLFIEIIEPEIT